MALFHGNIVCSVQCLQDASPNIILFIIIDCFMPTGGRIRGIWLALQHVSHMQSILHTCVSNSSFTCCFSWSLTFVLSITWWGLVEGISPMCWSRARKILLLAHRPPPLGPTFPFLSTCADTMISDCSLSSDTPLLFCVHCTHLQSFLIPFCTPLCCGMSHLSWPECPPPKIRL